MFGLATAGTPDSKLHVEEDSAATNTVTPVFRMTSTSSGTPAAGIGVGMEFEVETAAGNNEVGATIEAVTTDVTSTAEDFDLVFKTQAAGAAAAERLRLLSTGRITNPLGAIPHFWVYWTGNSTTILASYNMTSIANTGTGDADGTIDIDFSSANWAGFVTTSDSTATGWDADSIQSSGFNAKAAGTFGVLCGLMIDGTTAVGNLTNPQQWSVVGFGVSV
jgi:hypothetical protein